MTNPSRKIKIILKSKHKSQSITPNEIIDYHGISICYSSVDSFVISSRNQNDINNKHREYIIGAMLNNKIPIKYYENSIIWQLIHKNLFVCMNKLMLKEDVNGSIDHLECIHKGGRKFNYDFLVNINKNISLCIEFKFNTSTLSGSPQFVSPMYPSKYMNNSYEEFYYENYLNVLSNKYNLLLPDKIEYLNTIHSPHPKCMLEYQVKYYNGCNKSTKFTQNQNDINFYMDCKNFAKTSIMCFIEKTEIYLDKLSEYLINSQKDKNYLLYKNYDFYIEYININNYKLINFTKSPRTSSYIATNMLGTKIKILLRWKNGNGIAYPAFQIS